MEYKYYELSSLYFENFKNFLKKNKINIINFDSFLQFVKKINSIILDKNSKNINEFNIDKLKITKKELINNELELDKYSKKKIIFIDNYNLFLKIGINNFDYSFKFFNYKIINFLYNKKQKIEGIFLKKNNQLNIILNINICKNFYNKKIKKSVFVKEISNNLIIYEYKIYKYYLKKYRSILFTLFINIIEKDITIDKVLFQGKNLGGNILQLFIFDFFNNYKNINVNIKKFKKLNIILKQYNCPMLSESKFYEELLKIKKLKINNIFSSINKEYKSWNINIPKKEIL